MTSAVTSKAWDNWSTMPGPLKLRRQKGGDPAPYPTPSPPSSPVDKCYCHSDLNPTVSIDITAYQEKMALYDCNRLIKKPLGWQPLATQEKHLSCEFCCRELAHKEGFCTYPLGESYSCWGCNHKFVIPLRLKLIHKYKTIEL